jgi:uncharacterized membrane protein
MLKTYKIMLSVYEFLYIAAFIVFFFSIFGLLCIINYYSFVPLIQDNSNPKTLSVLLSLLEIIIATIVGTIIYTGFIKPKNNIGSELEHL